MDLVVAADTDAQQWVIASTYAVGGKLTNVGKSLGEAIAEFKKALEKDPEQSNILGNMAGFDPARDVVPVDEMGHELDIVDPIRLAAVELDVAVDGHRRQGLIQRGRRVVLVPAIWRAVDRAPAAGAVAEVAFVQMQLAQLRVRMALDIRGILTPDQLASLESILARHHEGGGPGPMGPDPESSGPDAMQ